MLELACIICFWRAGDIDSVTPVVEALDRRWWHSFLTVAWAISVLLRVQGHKRIAWGFERRAGLGPAIDS